MDTLGHRLVLTVTRANEDDRKQVGELARQAREATDERVGWAYVDPGYTGDKAAAAAQEHGIQLEVVKLPYAKRGFVPLPRRWVVERSFAWSSRFRRRVKDYERLSDTLAGLHIAALIILMLAQFAAAMQESA